ncbi:hypothetical protein FQA39_LY10747 [Lamprigera yunnana]|nr:hypothetical protein FQA39_LY10747 [Lamprigera yunnana]
MNEFDSSSSSPRQSTGSPPPKCAICLGTCSNKCYSDSCRHIFCFTCLLKWSKVKPECPLCKQPFKSIIHNIKSNDEYDEHIINNTEPLPRTTGLFDNDFLYVAPSPSRHFQFRTTFTVDTGGELAIQQMLLTHPLTNNFLPDAAYLFPGHTSRFGRLRHTRRASSATSFRRSIYMTNMWVYAPPDITGRYREVTPDFYRDNPAARNRLVPWLNRELNALLRENTQQVMHLVDVIMECLTRWHIRSRSFKRMLENYLSNKTQHFIHEFYNFMRSPYDMIGYDRHVMYSDRRPQTPTFLISDLDDDSDVTIVDVAEPIAVTNNPFRRPTIEVIEIDSDSSHDSDVIIGETPAPEIVLIDSDSNEEERTAVPPSNDSEDTEVNRKPILPLKIRLKRKRQSKERMSHNKKKSWKRRRSSSLSFSSSSSEFPDSSSSSDESSSHKKSKRKLKRKKSKRSHKEYKEAKWHIKGKHKKSAQHTETDSSSSSSDTESFKKINNFDSDDSIPLAQIKNKELKKQKSKRSHTETAISHTVTSKNMSPVKGDTQIDNEDHSKPSCSQWNSPIMNHSGLHNKLSQPSHSFPSTSSTMGNGSSGAFFSTIKTPPLDLELYGFGNVNQYGSYCTPYGSSYSSMSPGSFNSRLHARPKFTSYTPPPLVASSNSTESSHNPYRSLLFRNDHHFENRNYNCAHSKPLEYYSTPYNSFLPSRVNIGVGTSPLHDDDDFDNDSSTNYRLQSVIVKKEDNGNLGTIFFSRDSESENI